MKIGKCVMLQLHKIYNIPATAKIIHKVIE